MRMRISQDVEPDKIKDFPHHHTVSTKEVLPASPIATLDTERQHHIEYYYEDETCDGIKTRKTLQLDNLFEEWDSGIKIVDKELIEVGEVLGKGGFGKVYSCKYNQKRYGLKEIAKKDHIKKRTVLKALLEKKFMGMVDSPFVPRIHATFQDEDSLYILMDLIDGVNLKTLLAKKTEFSEVQVRFFAACILLGLEPLH